MEMNVNRMEDLTDTELMEWYRIAQELRDGRYLKAIKKEINRRCANE